MHRSLRTFDTRSCVVVVCRPAKRPHANTVQPDAAESASTNSSASMSDSSTSSSEMEVSGPSSDSNSSPDAPAEYHSSPMPASRSTPSPAGTDSADTDTAAFRQLYLDSFTDAFADELQARSHIAALPFLLHREASEAKPVYDCKCVRATRKLHINRLNFLLHQAADYGSCVLQIFREAESDKHIVPTDLVLDAINATADNIPLPLQRGWLQDVRANDSPGTRLFDVDQCEADWL